MNCTICKGTEDVKYNSDVSQFVDQRVYLCDKCRREWNLEEIRIEERQEEIRGEMLFEWFHEGRRKHNRCSCCGALPGDAHVKDCDLDG